MRFRLILPLAILLSACAEATPAVEGNLPREHQTSAADIAAGDGTDICHEFPEPSVQMYEADPNDPLAVQRHEFALGSADEAAVTFVLYGNLADASTADLVIQLQRVLDEHQGEPMRLVLRHFADESDQAAMLAAEALQAAGDQGGGEAFWAMAHALASTREAWVTTSGEELLDHLADAAEEAGLDRDEVLPALAAREYLPDIQAANTQARMVGGSAPPMLFVNEVAMRRLPGGYDEVDLIAQVFLLKQTYPTPPPMVIDLEKDYGAWIVTEKGTIALDLFADLAPQTVNNFAYLACAGYYDGVTFHRVLPGFVAQAGDPTGTGIGGPGYTINDEYFGSALRFDRKGWLSMAHTSQPNSAGSQFFILLGAAPHLDGAFTIFGEVVAGMDIAESLTPRDPENTPDAPAGDMIETLIVQELP